MSQENLDLVVRAMEAVLRRPKPDFETVNALYHPDHVLVPLAAHMLGEAEAKGAEGFRSWIEDTAGAVDWDAEVRGAVDVGPDKVLVVTRNRFAGATSGAETVNRVWSVVTVVDGKITRTDTYLDAQAALRAAGTSE
jgi:ketosteroid isomerase-like protein